jgi:hypothetical protein
MIAIGDATFQLTQLRPAALLLPYQESLSAEAPLSDAASDRVSAEVDPPSRSVWDDQPGQDAISRVTPEAPDGGNSLLIEMPNAVMPCVR